MKVSHDLNSINPCMLSTTVRLLCNLGSYRLYVPINNVKALHIQVKPMSENRAQSRRKQICLHLLYNVLWTCLEYTNRYISFHNSHLIKP